MKQCKHCPHPEHEHPTSPYAESSRCGYVDPDEEQDADPRPCPCRAGKTEMFEGVVILRNTPWRYQ